MEEAEMYRHYLAASDPSNREIATNSEYWTPVWGNLDITWNVKSLERTPEWKAFKRIVPVGARTLDAGCGMGRWVVLLEKMGYRPVGIDISRQTITRLKSTLPSYDWRTGDVRTLPFKNAEFDAIISWGLIEHFEDGPTAVLAEFRRVLKPGGHLFVTVPYLCWRRRLQIRRRQNNVGDFGDRAHTFYQHILTASELREWLASNGFDPFLIEPTAKKEGVSRALGCDSSAKPSLVRRCLVRAVTSVVPSRAVALMVLGVAANR